MQNYKRNVIIAISVFNIIILILNIFLFLHKNIDKSSTYKNVAVKKTKISNNISNDYMDEMDNLPYKMYYGKWKVNKIVGEDPRWGVSESSKNLIGHTIEYSRDSIKIDNVTKLTNPEYNTITAPVNPNFSVVENLPSLGNLGIQGKYFDLVDVSNSYKVKGDYFGGDFIIKDDTTLIMYQNYLYFELKRISRIEDPTIAFPG
jgi:hypothetical protein